jgi:hypothetical protein
MLSDRMKEIRAGIEFSESKIVLIVTRDHQDNTPGSWHASKIPLNGGRGWDHVAVAWIDKNGTFKFGEKTPEPGGAGPLWSLNKSGTAGLLSSEYGEVAIIPIDLSRFGSGARERFLEAFQDALKAPYSAVAQFGDHCSSAFGKGLIAAASKLPSWMTKLLDGAVKVLPFPIPNVYTPNNAFVDGKKLEAKRNGSSFRFDPDSDQGNTVRREAIGQGADENESALALWSAAIVAHAGEARASLNAETAADQRTPSEKEAPSESQDARTQHAVPQPTIGDDEHEDDQALEVEVTLASDAEHAPLQNLGQQPIINHNEQPSQVRPAATSDEDAPTLDPAQQLEIDDDDEEPSQEHKEDQNLADASDTEHAPTADAPVLETAKAEVGADPASGNHPAPALATHVPATPDDGFSFSLFPKPGVPLEVAKEVLPAEQTSPVEQSSSPGVPGSDSAHPDLDSANVGNAAPGHERVVHHGDLAP